MSYTGQDTLSQDSVFLQKVRQGIVRAAVDINGEVASTQYHAERAMLAFKVLNDPYGYATRFAPGVSADDTITAGSADLAIYNRVAAIWNDYALPY